MYSALVEPGEKSWLRYVAATQKCSAGIETSSLQNHGEKSQVTNLSLCLEAVFLLHIQPAACTTSAIIFCYSHAHLMPHVIHTKYIAIFWAEQNPA